MQDQLPKTFCSFIWHFLRPYKLVTATFIFLAIAAGFYGPFSSMITKYIIDLLPQLQNNDISPLILPSILIIVNFILFDNFTWRGVGYIRYKYQGVIEKQIINSTFEHVLRGSNQFFQENFAGRISNQITTLADKITDILGDMCPTLLRGFATLIMSFIVSSTTNSVFCYILIIWFICFTTFSLWMSQKMVILADARAESKSKVSGQVVDSITNHSNIRIFARKSFELMRMDKYLDSMLRSFNAQQGFTVLLHSIQGGMIAIMMGCAIYFLVHFYNQGIVTSGDFVLILGLSMELGYMMWHSMLIVDDFSQAYGECKQCLYALMITPEIQDKENAKPLVCNHGQITFDKVKFHYKGTKPLYENISIKINSGQKVGLVGYSGGGKSTFVNLVLRLHEVTGGAILIDRQDISAVTQDSLRANIAMISQDPSLFHRSLMDNIRYGKTNATDEEVIEAAKKAHAHEFIDTLPDGYNSLVGERGVKLSGGQRQRIAIARAILKDSPILILDEATSQLDSVTETLIQESLLALMESKTTIIIAHRLSTLLHMDRILVFNKGKIVEDGSHDELLTNQNGVYKKLWDAQVGGYLGDGEIMEIVYDN